MQQLRSWIVLEMFYFGWLEYVKDGWRKKANWTKILDANLNGTLYLWLSVFFIPRVLIDA